MVYRSSLGYSTEKNFDLWQKMTQEKRKEEVFHWQEKILIREKNSQPREKVLTLEKNYSIHQKKKSTQEKKGPIHVIKFLTCEKKNWSKNARTYENTRPTRLTRALDTPDLADSAIECDDPKLFGYALFELPPIFFMENNINYPRWTVLIL